MIARRLARWCLAPVCCLAALLPAPGADESKKGGASVLKVRIYGSLMPGYSKSDAKGYTQPVFDYLGEKIDQRMDCDVHDGKTPDDLIEFGKKLNSGEYHIGAVWGLEYGWLREKFPNLKVLAVVSGGEKDTPLRTHLYVRKDSQFTKLADLKGKRLAEYKDMSVMDRLFLRTMLRKEHLEPRGFFERKKEPYGVLGTAANAVKNGKADCVVMSATMFYRLSDLLPGMQDALEPRVSGDVYPMPVLIGSPDVVNKVRKAKGGLWDDLREQCLNAHKSAKGKAFVSFWRFDSFVSPDADYERKLTDIIRKYPVKVLVDLE